MKFSESLNQKIIDLKSKRESKSLGQVYAESELILAPMASICNAPFRLLMEELGAGMTVSELISCHGIEYKNERTLDMLKIHKDEENIGIQIFGEDADAMAYAAQVAEAQGPKFIDINMGCPVRKVVTKGGGSALLKDPKSLGPYLRTIKKALKIPLTIKIRMGWDAEGINADEIIKVAEDEGIEFVAIHGRTRAQQYTGKADWKYIESLALESKVPLIGNGDLHHPYQVKNKMKDTNCQGLMIARGALRNPFIFLEAYQEDNQIGTLFNGDDYFEIIKRLQYYTEEMFEKERTKLVQMRKLIVWFAAGFKGASQFRGNIFATKTLDDCMKYTEDYFLGLNSAVKSIDYTQTFMNSGHG